jgi:hypothetical protein
VKQFANRTRRLTDPLLVLDEGEAYVPVSALAEPDARRDGDVGLARELERELERTELRPLGRQGRPHEHRSPRRLDVPTGALAKLKSYLDYGTFQPIQIAAIVAMNEASDYPRGVCEIYHSRRNALCDGLARVGWQVARPKGTMFVWAPIPEPYRELGSLEFALKLIREAGVAVSPGVGFGPGGDGHVRFALVENEHRIGQAIRGIRRALPELS